MPLLLLFLLVFCFYWFVIALCYFVYIMFWVFVVYFALIAIAGVITCFGGN